ncbi:MAG TPA: alpha-amylase family glycosyl hydrolase [Actinomycetota bacterium]|nr:alpha-amylase family glycosyl hydrolase [Actinomycetota bacterium]
MFGWEERVRGAGRCSDVVALVDGAEVDAEVEVDGEGFSFRVPIRTGPNNVTARCILDEGSTIETDPITFTGMLASRPTARIDVSVNGSTVVFDGAPSEPTEPDGTPIETYEWTPYRQVGAPEPHLQLAGGGAFRRETGRRLEIEAPARDGEYFVTLTATDAEGTTDSSTTYFVVEDGQPRTVDLMHEHPAWIDRAIVYAPVHQLWGGGAASVEERLPYLRDLGVDALWLWPPVTRRAPGEEYAIADYFSIDEEWGSPEEMRSLVDRAHELGLRVLLDFVPNHSSIEHRYYQTAQQEGPGSHYWDFYDRKPNGEFTHYFDWTHLPNLNYDNPQVRTMMTEAFSYWIRDFDVDGFRVDAAWGIKRRRPDYWAPWREELKRIKPDLLLLAEATARDRYYFENGFDVGYDWTDHPGQWPWASAWEFPQEIQALLVPSLTNQDRGYPRGAIVLRFLNNNDTGVRFAERYGADMTRVASALQFTVPGIPLMFGGDEIGARYQPYTAYDRIPWKDRYGLRPWYDGLIELRERLPALLSRELSVLTTNWGSVIAYVRPRFRGGDPVLVVLNFAGRANPTIESSPALDEVLSTGAVEDALTGERIDVRAGDDLTLRMPQQSVHVLVPSSGGAS